MQSSPPQRAAGPASEPASPATSHYSIDLAALDHDSRSGASSPLPRRQIDRILSEDIDGPTDFTLNMEKYFRAGGMRKGGLDSMKEQSRESQAQPTGQADAGDGTLRVGEVEATAASRHTPSNSPPKESPFNREVAKPDHEDFDDATVDDGGSEWDPYVEAQTPMRAQRGSDRQNAFLQPSVEEDYSDLTPARAISLQAAQRSIRRPRPAEQHSPSRDQAPEPERFALSPTLSPQRSPMVQHGSPRPRSAQDDLEEELEALRAKCQQLESLNATLSITITNERRQRTEETAAHEAQIADFLRREKDLTDMKTQSQQHKEDFRQEFATLKEKVQAFERQQASHREEIERLKREHVAEIKRLKDESEQAKQQHAEDLRATEQDLELAERGLEDAEETAKSRKEELDGKVQEVERLSKEIIDAEELRVGIKDQLLHLKMENERFESVEEELESKVAEIEGLKTELQSLKQQLKTEQERRLVNESSITAAAASSADEVQRLENELEELRSKYNSLIINSDAVDDGYDELQAKYNQEKAARMALEAEKEVDERNERDNDVVNSALAAKISGAIRKREEYWRGRVAKLEDERKVMVKALMRGWGKEECGLDGNGMEEGKGWNESGWQVYEYAFATDREKGGKIKA